MALLSANQRIFLPQFSKYVESVCLYNGAQILNDQYARTFLMHPEGIFEIILQFNTPVFHRSFGEHCWQERANVFVGGLHRHPYELKITRETRLLSIRFQPGKAKFFLKTPLDKFCNELVPIDQVFSSSIQDIIERIGADWDNTLNVYLIEKLLNNLFSAPSFSPIDSCVDAIVQLHGNVDIVDMQVLSGLSIAQFRKRFREEIGLSPKQFVRIIRVNAVTQILTNMRAESSFTELAYRFGYFDQSHFIRDFKGITGMIPSAYCA